MGEQKNVWGFRHLGTWGIMISLFPYLPSFLTTVNFAHPVII